jgi:uncharacterized protein YbjT (DUF2867 family)
MSERFTLVLGGTGKSGRRVAERLWARGLPVAVGSRSGTPPFDWEDRATWAPVLRGARAAYVSYQPDLAAPGAPEAVGALAAEAAAAGVERLVLLSGRGEEEAQRSEAAAAEAGVDLTVVRASWFAQNFSEGHLLEPVMAGELALPVGDVPEPFIDLADIADVAVAALTEDGHAGRVYEVTGPRALTFAEAAAEIGRAAGREVRFARVPMDDHAAAMAAEGAPADVVALTSYLFTEVMDGRNVRTADGVREALGREPRDFADWARAAAAAGAWSAAPAARR